MIDRRAGFTLLEVLIALTALGFVTAICYGAFHVAIRAIERGEVAVTTAQRLRACSDALRQIRSMMYRTIEYTEDEDPVRFKGDSRSLTFTTTMQLQGGGGVSRVTYEVLEDPTRLVLTETDVQGFGAMLRGASLFNERSVVLLEGFSNLTFTYFDSAGEDYPRWGTSADEFGESEPEMPPAKVRIEIDGVPGIETGRWVQEIPVMIRLMNDGITPEGSEGLAEMESLAAEEEEALDDEDPDDEDPDDDDPDEDDE